MSDDDYSPEMDLVGPSSPPQSSEEMNIKPNFPSRFTSLASSPQSYNYFTPGGKRYLLSNTQLSTLNGHSPKYILQPSTRQSGFIPQQKSYYGRMSGFGMGGFGGVVGGGGRHSSAFMPPVSPRKRQILFRQCFFNPISCF